MDPHEYDYIITSNAPRGAATEHCVNFVGVSLDRAGIYYLNFAGLRKAINKQTGRTNPKTVGVHSFLTIRLTEQSFLNLGRELVRRREEGPNYSPTMGGILFKDPPAKKPRKPRKPRGKYRKTTEQYSPRGKLVLTPGKDLE